MRITSLDSSSTKRHYQVTFETPEESQMLPNELFDYIDSYNFGGSIMSRNNEQALCFIYID